jgi:hypothetical protein
MLNRKTVSKYLSFLKSETIDQPYSPCNKYYPQECCDCLFQNDNNPCQESFSNNCIDDAKSKCETCANVCPNICNPDYGGGTNIATGLGGGGGGLGSSQRSPNEIFGEGCYAAIQDAGYSIGPGDNTGPAPFGGIDRAALIRLVCPKCSGLYGPPISGTGLCGRDPAIAAACSSFCNSCCGQLSTGDPGVITPGGGVDTDPGGGPGGPDGPGGGGGCNQNAPPDACKQCLFGNGAPGGDDFDIMYRHTACYFIWYPPEYAFGGEPMIPQCQAYHHSSLFGSVDRSCSPAFNVTTNNAGILNPNALDSPCIGGSPPLSGTWPSTPCECRRFAHIKGGIQDTVFKKENISKKEYQYGYLPFMNPFQSPMKKSEIGCCWCGSPGMDTVAGVFARNSAIARNNITYPFHSGKFRLWTQGGMAGEHCSFSPSSNPSIPANIPAEIYNPRYRKLCFAYGISPYLMRLALQEDKNNGKLKSGFDIWTFGRSDDPNRDFGPSYDPTRFQKISSNDMPIEYDIRYKEVTVNKTRLKDQLIGYVTLEHHFEAWAHRSGDGVKHPNLAANLNHGNVLSSPFEIPYSGNISGNDMNFHGQEAIRYSLIRTSPRRVMYVGSQIPIFHFDLYTFKLYSLNNNLLIAGELFNPERFLKGYYNYFYSLIEKGNRAPTPTPIDIDGTTLISDYAYVSAALEEMVRAGILRVKDHAIDIATETTQIIQSAEYDVNNDIVLNPYISSIVGGTAGYKNLVEFLDVEPVTGSVTPKIIKQKLLSDTTVSKFQDLQTFPFPRRAVLPSYIESGIAVAWGCTGDSCRNNVYDQITVPSILTVVSLTNPWFPKGISKVTAGLNTNFWHTYQGKLVASGYGEQNLANCLPRDLVADQDNQAAGADPTLGILVKLGGKSSTFEVALVEYPEFFDFNQTSTSCTSSPSQDSFCDLADGVIPRIPGENYPVYNYDAKLPQYRLRSWGNKACDYGTFVRSSFSNPGGYGDYADNREMVWSDVANGSKHTVAISSMGELAVTGDNTDNIFQYGQNNENLPGTNNIINRYDAKPGYVSEGEYNVTLQINSSGLFYGRYNGITYGNINETCRYSSSTPDDLKDARTGLIQRVPIDDSGNTINGLTAGYSRPYYTQIGSGNYHAIAIQSDNQVRVWGAYYYINPLGEKIGTTIPTFLPDSVKNLADQWTVTYKTDIPSSSQDESLLAESFDLLSQHSPTDKLIFVDGGPDYSMVASNSTVYVWGRTEMLPTYKTTDLPGATGSWSQTFDGDIIKITAGSNGFAVLYKTRNDSQLFGTEFFRVNKTFIWTRKNENYYGLSTPDPDDISEFGYSDISFGYGHAIALKYGDVVSPTWNYRDFVDPEAVTAQFGAGTSNIPKYFQRQAFFRAVPGNWDFSKWIYGGFCDQRITNSGDPVAQPDPCSILGYNFEGTEDISWQYSGNPQYWWMNSFIRRYQSYVPNHSVEVDDITQCTQYLDFGNQASGLSDGNSSISAGCPEKADICWQSTGMPLLEAARGWAPQDSGCALVCESNCEGGTCIRNCCPDGPSFSDICATSVGKVGFNSNKDYFIQSYKQFSRKNGCCKTHITNISYFNYVQKLTYFGYDEASSTYKTFFTKDPYRHEYNKPSNALKIFPYDSVLQYPYVYLGEARLDKLQDSYFFALRNQSQTGKPCDGNGTVGCILADPGASILGPGGWIWYVSPDGQDTPLGWQTDGTADDGIVSYQRNVPVGSPYKLASSYVGVTDNPWLGATLPCYSSGCTDDQLNIKLLVFDVGNTYNYAPPLGGDLKKWHLINAFRPNSFNGVTFDRVSFSGFINPNPPPLSSYQVIVSPQTGPNPNQQTPVVQSGDITCQAIVTEP